MLRFIVTGTGRSGTAYIAQVLNHAGIFCGHEWVYTPEPVSGDLEIIGDSSAQAAPVAASFPGLVFHQTREPLKVIGSFLNFGLFKDYRRCGAGGEFVARHFQFTGEPLCDAMRYYVEWNRMCEREERYLRWRVEDVDADLIVRLGERIGHPVKRDRAEVAIASVPRDCNTRNNRAQLAWADLPAGAQKEALKAAAVRYGYACEDVD